MHFPRYWAKAVEGEYQAWRWSDRSVDEARASAAQAVRALVQRFANTGGPEAGKSGYGYGGPFREEVVREIAKDGDSPTALISRNNMGCLVLNSSDVMFVDIDLEPEQSGGGFLKRLFGGSSDQAKTPKEEAISRIEDLVRRKFSHGCRLYETSAGLRLLFTETTFEPKSSDVKQIFIDLKADPLYAKLCDTQNSFRARLTPKPWRCNQPSLTIRWPWDTPEREQKFRSWEQEYKRASESYATCRFVQEFGSGSVHKSVEPVLRVHDELTKAETGLPLA